MSSKVKIILVAVIFILFLFPQEITAQVVINEVLPNPSGDDKQNEWVELYNSGDTEVDILGYRLTDKSDAILLIDNSKTGSTTIIPPHGWLVVHRNGDNSFSLNNDGVEIVNLFAFSSSPDPINTFQYTDSVEDKSWGRIPDGGPVSDISLVVSPGAANQLPTPSPTSSPSPTPTATSTSTPTATPTNTPTPTLIKTPTPTPKKTSTPSPLPSIALAQEGTPPTNPPIDLLGIATESGGITDKKGPPIIPIILISCGGIFIIGAGLALAKKGKSEYNLKDNESVTQNN